MTQLVICGILLSASSSRGDHGATRQSGAALCHGRLGGGEWAGRGQRDQTQVGNKAMGRVFVWKNSDFIANAIA